MDGKIALELTSHLFSSLSKRNSNFRGTFPISIRFWQGPTMEDLKMDSDSVIPAIASLPNLFVSIWCLNYQDNICGGVFSLNGNGDSFGALVWEGSLHHSDQFAVDELQGGDLVPFNPILAGEIRWWTHGSWCTLQGRIENQTAGTARK